MFAIVSVYSLLLILVFIKKLEKLFIAPKVRQDLHETAFVAFAAKGHNANSGGFLIKTKGFY